MLDLRRSYLVMIKNSVGSRMFRNSYVIKDGRRKDILQNGELSCAFFATFILKGFNLIGAPHCTVQGAIKDLIKSGWQEIKISEKIPSGAVLLWEKQKGHFHLGFYLGNWEAVSNSRENKCPIVHHWTFNSSRKIIKAYSHKFLEDRSVCR